VPFFRAVVDFFKSMPFGPAPGTTDRSGKISNFLISVRNPRGRLHRPVESERITYCGQNTDNLHQKAAMACNGQIASLLFSMKFLVGAVGIETKIQSNKS